MRQGNTLLYRKYIAQMADTYRQRSDIRMFVEMILTSTAIFLFAIFAIRPTLVTIGGLTTEISEKHETIDTMNTKIQNIIAAQNLYNSETTRLSLLDTAVPAEPSLTSYVKQVEAVAAAHSVSVFSINTSNVPLGSPAESGEAEQKMTVAVTFTGDYPNLLATLKDIQALRRPILSSSAGITLDESGTAAQLYLSVSGDIPYLPRRTPTSNQ